MTLKRVDLDEFLIGIKESEVEMTTTKLTHDEASHLRAFRSGGLVVTDVPAWMCSLSMAGLIEMPFISHQRWGCKITDAGREALAEYDAHHTTIDKAELERLLALERKIVAFFESATCDRVSAAMGPMCISESGHDIHWWLAGRGHGGCASFADAMRIAFELFEGPKEKLWPPS